MRKTLFGFLLATIACLAPLHAKAGIPVIDAAAVANLVQQLGAWQQQLQAMKQQYDQLQQSKEQLQQTYNSMTGTRGMDRLLTMTDQARNYLPSNYNDLISTIKNASANYSGLSNQAQIILKANSILSGSQLQNLSPEMRLIVEQGRQASAMFSGSTQLAYQNTSQRFSALQNLITRIGSAQDPKAIFDLQARIQAEQVMLTNEQTKLQNLYQASVAEESARRLRIRERSTADIGTAKQLNIVNY